MDRGAVVSSYRVVEQEDWRSNLYDVRCARKDHIALVSPSRGHVVSRS